MSEEVAKVKLAEDAPLIATEEIPPPSPPSSSAHTSVPVAVAVSTPPFAKPVQLSPSMTTEPPGARMRLLVLVVIICGFVPPSIKFPFVRTGT